MSEKSVEEMIQELRAELISRDDARSKQLSAIQEQLDQVIANC